MHHRAAEIWQAAFGSSHPTHGISLNNIGLVFHAQKRHAEAKEHFAAALASWERVLEPEHPFIATAAANLGMSLVDLGEYEEALKVLERARRAFLASGVPSVDGHETEFHRARALWELGRRTEARELASTAKEGLLRLEDDARVRHHLAIVEDWLGSHPS